MKKFPLGLGILLFGCLHAVAQTDSTRKTDSFDVFLYKAPEYFTKSVLPSRVQFNLANSDTSFCTITVYKSQVAKSGVDEVNRQWTEHIIKKLTRADKKPQTVMKGQQLDGWASTLAIGNFYQNKKKCVVMLNTFTKDKVSACVVFMMTDKSFKYPVETFSRELHLK